MENSIIKEWISLLEKDRTTLASDASAARKTLSEMRCALKESGNLHLPVEEMGALQEILREFLQAEDAKTRKNTALLLGELGGQAALMPLWEAYRREKQLFVRSSYLSALLELDYRDCLPEMKECLKELENLSYPEEERKHREEELRSMIELIAGIEGRIKHTFVGYRKPAEVILMTNRDHKQVTAEQLKPAGAAVSDAGAGLMVRTEQLDRLLDVRTWQELLFLIPGIKSVPSDPEQAAKRITGSELLAFLKTMHREEAPFYFRTEVKTKLPPDKKSAFIKKLSAGIERLTERKLINSKSDYEIELRLIENKQGSFHVLLKLYTIEDKRFTYRQETIAASIKPYQAALAAELAQEFMKDSARVLDPFCGVGTMLIERLKKGRTDTTYGVDISGEAIEVARRNTDRIGMDIHYINRDIFTFRHEYPFDEIFTNMPFSIGAKSGEQIQQLYRRFLKYAGELLHREGVLILYSHDGELLRRMAPGMGYHILKKWEINRKEGTSLYVLTAL